MNLIDRILTWLSGPKDDFDEVEKELKESESFTYEQIDTKIYRILKGRLRHIGDLDVWLSHNYDSNHWNLVFDREQKKIDEIRAWARTLPYGPERRSYLDWLDYYFEWGLNAARKELKDHKIEREQKAYSTRTKKVYDTLSNVKVPEPPR